MLSILYPPICPVCGEILAGDEKKTGIHRACGAKLIRVREPVCKKCGKPISDPQKERCGECEDRRVHFVSGRSLWVYNDSSGQAIFRYKYIKKRELADFFARQLLAAYGGWIRRVRPDMIVPVPVSRARYHSRGFNQAGLIAVRLGEALDIPVEQKGLKRIRDTAPQKELGRLAREANLLRAFCGDPAVFKGTDRVLVIDDIYTTGSTIEACARALRRAGAGHVWFLTLCSVPMS